MLERLKLLLGSFVLFWLTTSCLRADDNFAVTMVTGAEQFKVDQNQNVCAIWSPTSVLFVDFKYLACVGSVATVDYPGITRGSNESYLVAYANPTEKTCTIAEYSLNVSQKSDPYIFPHRLFENVTGLEQGPVIGAVPMVSSQDGLLWLLTEREISTNWSKWIEAFDWNRKKTVLSVELPNVQDAPRIFPLAGGCVVTYYGASNANLYLPDGKKLTADLTDGSKVRGTFEIGVTKGNKLWGMGRQSEMTVLEYDQKAAEFRARFLKFDTNESDFFYPLQMAYDPGENVLVVSSGDGGPQAHLVRLVDPNTGKVIKRMELPTPCISVVYRDHKIYAVLDDARITVYDEWLRMIRQGPPLFPVLPGYSLTR